MQLLDHDTEQQAHDHADQLFAAGYSCCVWQCIETSKWMVMYEK